MKILETMRLTKRFFGVAAVDKVDLYIEKGEIVGLIGPNGSGKTTLFNCVTGLLRPEEGQVMFNREEITNLKAHKIALKGLTRTFQLVNIFPKMTVTENMLVANQAYRGEKILESFFGSDSLRSMEEEDIKNGYELLKALGIFHLRDEHAASLSYGQQKLLEIAMALMPDPQICLMDEPTAAVNPVMIKTILDMIKTLNKKNHKTFFIIEHNMDVIRDVCSRVIVLDHGEKIAEGTPLEVRNNPLVIEAYFGG